MQFHSQRERESKTNKDIDYTKSDLNYDLHNSTQIDFNKVVHTRLESLENAKKIRKDAVVMVEFIATSDKEFFDKLSPEGEKRFFQESYNFLAERYGRENVIHANVHLDEKTPHLHMGIVPILKDGRLCAKDLFKRQDLQDLQTDYNKHMRDSGFDLERGEPSDRHHLETQELKKQTLNKEIQQAQEEINALQGIQKTIDDINIDQEDKTLFKGKIKVNKDELEDVLVMAKKSVLLEKENDELQERNKFLEEDYKRLRKKTKEEEDQAHKYSWQVYDLQNENKRLNNLISMVENFLRDRFPNAYESLKKYLNREREQEHER